MRRGAHRLCVHLRAVYVSFHHLDHRQHHHDLSGAHDHDEEHEYDHHDDAAGDL